MDDSGLLVRLSKYRPREGRSSLEDFVTEAFAWLLQADERFQDAFLKFVTDRLAQNGREVQWTGGDAVDWSTQENFDQGWFDMVAKDPNALLVFEHKVHATSSRKQIEKYREAAQRLGSDREARVLMITAHQAQFEDADSCFCWEEIYHLIGDFRKGNSDGSALDPHLEDFQELLQYHGLGPKPPVSHLALQAYPVARHLEDDLKRLFDRVENRDWNFFTGFEMGGREKRYRRIGLSFRNVDTKGWTPGFMVVCVLEGTDLGIDDRIAYGLKLHVIPSFRPSLHGHYPEMEGYEQLKEDMRAVAADTGWVFNDHFGTSASRNRHHPLHLEYPLDDLLSGTHTLDEQSDKVYRATRTVLEGLLHLDGVRELKQECESAIAKD